MSVRSSLIKIIKIKIKGSLRAIWACKTSSLIARVDCRRVEGNGFCVQQSIYFLITTNFLPHYLDVLNLWWRLERWYAIILFFRACLFVPLASSSLHAGSTSHTIFPSIIPSSLFSPHSFSSQVCEPCDKQLRANLKRKSRWVPQYTIYNAALKRKNNKWYLVHDKYIHDGIYLHEHNNKCRART